MVCFSLVESCRVTSLSSSPLAMLCFCVSDSVVDFYDAEVGTFARFDGSAEQMYQPPQRRKLHRRKEKNLVLLLLCFCGL